MTYNMESYGAVYFLTSIMEKNYYYYLFLEIFSELGKKEKNYTSPSRKDLNV
jgi:effector-binding domain-containing protein